MSASKALYKTPEVEIIELRQKLKEMFALCQQLQEKIDKLECGMRNGDMKTMDAQMEEKQDVASLKEKMRELLSMNLNWQKFHGQQEKLIQELNEKITRLERELATRTTGATWQLPESQQIEFDQMLLAKKRECHVLEEEKTKTEEDNRRLRRKLSSVEKELEELKERCQLLEEQLVMYQEDFKTERSDRERAQSKIAKLEMQLTEYQGHQASRSSHYNPYDSYRPPYDFAPHADVLRGRGLYQTDGATDAGSSSTPESRATKEQGGHIGLTKGATIVVPTTSVYETDGFDETDFCHVDLTEDDPSGGGGGGGPGERRFSPGDFLSCPNCRRAFSRDQHLELVEHMEDCN